MRAWYSAAADRKFGHAVYADSSGLEIKVTEVVTNPDSEPGSRWNDLIYVGEVVRLVRTANKPDPATLWELHQQISSDLKEQEDCRKQFTATKKCFCYTCPINNKN